jgi:primase-polymerase (primpol)-like protein
MEREPVLHRFDRVPEELKGFRQWVNWRLDIDRKVPVNPTTLSNAGVQWPNTWSSFDKARDVAIRNELGIGFVLTADDPYTYVDSDHCVDERGEVSDQTRAILCLLAGYVELSPSGTGLHIWMKSELPINRRGVGIEIYSSKRWMTMTGRHNPHIQPVIPERTAQSAKRQTPRGDESHHNARFALHLAIRTVLQSTRLCHYYRHGNLWSARRGVGQHELAPTGFAPRNCLGQWQARMAQSVLG